MDLLFKPLTRILAKDSHNRLVLKAEYGNFKRLLRHTAMVVVALAPMMFLASCGDDESEEPDLVSSIDGYWSATIYQVNSADYYMLSFKDGFCQFYECHSGETMRSNAKFQYNKEESTLRLSSSDGDRSGSYDLRYVDANTIVLRLPKYGEVTLEKVAKWDTAPGIIMYWRVDNALIYGTLTTYSTDREGFILSKDGTGSVVYYKTKGDISRTTRYIKWSYHPYGGEGNGELWFRLPTLRLQI